VSLLSSPLGTDLSLSSNSLSALSLSGHVSCKVNDI
jgi:hypothetical protein